MVVVLAFCTVRVKFCVAFGNVPLLAVIVTECEPTVPAAGVPLKTPAELRVTPVGKVPVVTANVGAGEPLAVTLKVPANPAVKVVAFALVMAGAVFGIGFNEKAAMADPSWAIVAGTLTVEEPALVELL